MDPLSIIASMIGIIQGISSTYKTIQDVKDLPKAFDKVNESLPLVGQTLNLAHNELLAGDIDESLRTAIEPITRRCEEKLKALKDIFDKVASCKKDERGGNDWTVLFKVYRSTLRKMGKGHRVEVLMRDITTDVSAFAQYRLFGTATQSQVAQLKNAFEKLSSVEPSMPDSDFDSPTHNVNQNIASGGTGYQNFSNVTGNQYNARSIVFGDTQNQNREKRNAILNALCTSPYKSRKNRNPGRVPGTCEWFVQHTLFQQWRESKTSSMLWLSANPGCGKSVLARHLIDCELPLNSEASTICYFFFKDDFEDQRSAKSALSCILHQLFKQRKELFSDEIVDRFEVGGGHDRSSLDDLWDILDTTVSQDQQDTSRSSEIVCILDAFDECEDKEQSRLAQILCDFYRDSSTIPAGASSINLKFLVTSRPYGSIRKSFQPLNEPGLPLIHVSGESEAEVDKIACDISVFIEAKVQELGPRLRLTPTEKELLLEKLLHSPQRTYLWAHLTLDLVKSDFNRDMDLRDVTSRLPPTLDDAYERILAKSCDSEKARKLLHIVVAATRPLTLQEMDFALTLQQRHKTYDDVRLEPEDRFREEIRDLCGLFVTITDSKIYLLHQTAKKFLVYDHATDGSNQLVSLSNHFKWKSSLRLQESNRVLSQICVWHLHFTTFKTHPIALPPYYSFPIKIKAMKMVVSQYVKEHVFLHYSASNWAAHFLASESKEDEEAAISLLGASEAASFRSPTWFEIYWTETYGHIPRGFTSLMIASYFGLTPLVGALLEDRGIDVNAKSSYFGRSALSWASEQGCVQVVELLVDCPERRQHFAEPSSWKSVEVDSTDMNGEVPLSYATTFGHEAIVKLLLKAGAEVNMGDSYGQMPLSWAALNGSEAVIRILLDAGADVNVADDMGRTPLLWAANKGNEAVVRLLLDAGADVNMASSWSETPFLQADGQRNEAVIRLLLGAGVDVNMVDSWGRMPLAFAAGKGNEAVVRFLLNVGADVNMVDDWGQTPLSQAAGKGNEAVVRILLEAGADVNVVDGMGLTPLSQAAGKENEAVVRLLLGAGADVNIVDGMGLTPLSRAARKENEAAVRLLLDAGADVNMVDDIGLTPLLWVVRKGNKVIARLLLDAGADVNMVDDINLTPLSWAVRKGNEAVVRFLLDAGADVNMVHSWGQTPLSLAIEYGHRTVEQMLRKAGAVA